MDGLWRLLSWVGRGERAVRTPLQASHVTDYGHCVQVRFPSFQHWQVMTPPSACPGSSGSCTPQPVYVLTVRTQNYATTQGPALAIQCSSVL